MIEQRDYEYKMKHKKLGGHIHCRLFSRRRGALTWAGCGDLIFRAEEWIAATRALKGVVMEEEE